jgi:hypothetical protein
MALTSKSLFLYGFTVDAYNANLTFNIGGAALSGYLPYGSYSLDTLCQAVVTLLSSLAPSRLFSYSINRTVSGGLENRVTLTCSTGTFGIDFSVAASIGPTLGFNASIYTGSLSYTGSVTAGTALVPELVGYTYLGPDFYKDINGAVNISATGLKEAIVFQIMQFMQVEFKYEPQAKVITQWSPFWNWAIQQKVFEFTPQVSDPTTYYEVTLEKSSSNGKGLGFKMTEMLPNFPFYYQTGMITMRRQINPTFITG